MVSCEMTHDWLHRFIMHVLEMCHIHQAYICPQPIFKWTFWLIDSQSNFFSFPHCIIFQTVVDVSCCHVVSGTVQAYCCCRKCDWLDGLLRSCKCVTVLQEKSSVTFHGQCDCCFKQFYPRLYASYLKNIGQQLCFVLQIMPRERLIY